MKAVKIEVTTYSGYRGEEGLLSFVLHDERIEIAEIIERWIEEGVEDRVRKRYFRVKGSDGYVHVLFVDESTGEWFAR